MREGVGWIMRKFGFGAMVPPVCTPCFNVAPDVSWQRLFCRKEVRKGCQITLCATTLTSLRGCNHRPIGASAPPFYFPLRPVRRYQHQLATVTRPRHRADPVGLVQALFP